MAGSRISVVVHDGSRIIDRKRIGQEAKDQTAMEITRSFYQTEVRSYKDLGDEVVAIGGLKKGEGSGFQLYLAIEVGGRVVEMGLPFIKNQSGDDLFLNPANLRPGDMEAIAPHLPPDAEILMVWRLDRGMDKDITLTDDSIISAMRPPLQGSGTDYSMLDKKACISCGGGASGKLDFIADIMQVKLFCGDRDDPIRMSTLMIPSPETFVFDGQQSFPASNPSLTDNPSQSPQALQLAQSARILPHWRMVEPVSIDGGIQGNILADTSSRTSWEDAARIGESFLSSFSIFYRRQVSGADQMAVQRPDGVHPMIPRFDAGTTVVLYRTPKKAAESIPLPLQALNPSERRLWADIHSTRSDPVLGIPSMDADPDQSLMQARSSNPSGMMSGKAAKERIPEPRSSMFRSIPRLNLHFILGKPVERKTVPQNPVEKDPGKAKCPEKRSAQAKLNGPESRVEGQRAMKTSGEPQAGKTEGARNPSGVAKEPHVGKPERRIKPRKSERTQGRKTHPALIGPEKRIAIQTTRTYEKRSPSPWDFVSSGSMRRHAKPVSIRAAKSANKTAVYLFNDAMGIYAHSSKKRRTRKRAFRL